MAVSAKSRALEVFKRASSSVDRALAILEFFTSQQPIWSTEMLMTELGLTRATTYRYIKSLSDAGYLVATAGGGYTLGPRFIEMDRRIRLGDPLLRVAPPIMNELPKPFVGAQILSGFYGNRAVTIYVDQADKELTLQMERGRSFPLLAGPPSRIILAHLPTYQLRNLLLSNPLGIAKAGLGENWHEFSQNLKAIRKTGYDAAADFDQRVIAIAAPIFRSSNAVIASLCLVRRKAISKPEDMSTLIELATTTGEKISKKLQELHYSTSQAAPQFPAARLGKKSS
ncbi:IclR family transcriptional regulator [Pontivivens nitratireducens]|uniref:Helix-turn-helix domain-containing protein n=1 Tax=Pontivivens nitratireducens TaxID=2758038 RepID=A0A6G7VNX7_9RHOB|nr:IclR family transcriptional regulator C-terminal domain-containing protein [Pontibrevibacter nitratireducens]QIK41576.1 helix-turn-helix domain-containing protein [Pontibrevibacter nitratireducens]